MYATTKELQAAGFDVRQDGDTCPTKSLMQRKAEAERATRLATARHRNDTPDAPKPGECHAGIIPDPELDIGV